ncbi:MAG: hypothetical protein WCJ30_27040, partial [Deltaproteobacteria bacterium]
MSLRHTSPALALILAACSPAVATHGTTLASGSPSPSSASVGPQLPPADAACRDAPVIEAGGTVRASTTGRADLFHATCAFGAGSPDAVYRIHIERPTRVVLRVSAGYDSAVYLRRACADGHTELACNDDSTDAHHSALQADVMPGDYFAFVDGYESNSAGFYALTYTALPAPPSVVAAMSSAPPASSAPSQATITHVAGERGVSGTVRYAKRSVTPHGLTRATTDTDAPRCIVEAVGEGDHVVATAETDDAGAFHLDLEPGVRVRVRALSRSTYLGNDIRVVSDPGTESPYEVTTETFAVTGGEHVAFRADVGGAEPAGAFNILTQFVHYLPYVQRGFGHPLPPLFAFWRRGNNTALPQGNITAFLLEYHRHAGTYALQIQGGDPGHEDSSDSDQFDDPVILHEFTHFVVHTMAGHFSTGGRHQNGELHFPGQALDEGAAT